MRKVQNSTISSFVSIMYGCLIVITCNCNQVYYILHSNNKSHPTQCYIVHSYKPYPSTTLILCISLSPSPYITVSCTPLQHYDTMHYHEPHLCINVLTEDIYLQLFLIPGNHVVRLFTNSSTLTAIPEQCVYICNARKCINWNECVEHRHSWSPQCS